MKKIYRFILSLQFIFRPSYWILKDGYSEGWDHKLNKLLDENSFKNFDYYTAVLGTQKIWIANHPYASFTPHGDYSKKVMRPSRLTIKRARKKLLKDMFGE